MNIYAGVGARETPSDVLTLMNNIAAHLSNCDFTLRSGGANGADTAFSVGSNKSEHYLPWPKYNGNSSTLCEPSLEAIEIASKFHPNWGACSQGVRKLHGRNAHIILGENLDSPVDFVICWTKNGKDSGGTGLAIRLAEFLDIPVYNLHSDEIRNKFMEMIRE